METDIPPEENELERAFRFAATEPAHRPAFFKLLMESTVYIIVPPPDETTEGARNMQTGESVRIKTWHKQDGTPVIPFFTSKSALERAIDRNEGCMGLPAWGLFEMVRGTMMVLNPGSQYSKEFFPNEIEGLLAAGINLVPESRKVEKDMPVQLRQPDVYPTEMAASLGLFLAKNPVVKRAYLTLMLDPASGEPEHFLFGIETEQEDDYKKVYKEFGSIAHSMLPPGEILDMTPVVPGKPGIGEYFIHNVKPFYERAS